jgi:hypothetical protein
LGRIPTLHHGRIALGLPGVGVHRWLTTRHGLKGVFLQDLIRALNQEFPEHYLSSGSIVPTIGKHGVTQHAGPYPGYSGANIWGYSAHIFRILPMPCPPALAGGGWGIGRPRSKRLLKCLPILLSVRRHWTGRNFSIYFRNFR